MFSRQDLLSERQVYRTTGSLVAWWGWAAFAVLILVVLALGHHDHAALVTAVVVIAITGIMYACALHPRIVASAADLTVVNPLRTHVVPWSAVTQVDLVHNVRIHCQGPERCRDRAQLGGPVVGPLPDPQRAEGPPRRPPRDGPRPRARPAPRRGPGRPGRIGGRVRRPAAGRAGPAAATAAAPDAPSAGPRVRWTWGPIAAMAVPLLILLAVALA